jgi:hypothetical protein
MARVFGSTEREIRRVVPLNHSPGHDRTENLAVEPSSMTPTRFSGTGTVRLRA